MDFKFEISNNTIIIILLILLILLVLYVINITSSSEDESTNNDTNSCNLKIPNKKNKQNINVKVYPDKTNKLNAETPTNQNIPNNLNNANIENNNNENAELNDIENVYAPPRNHENIIYNKSFPYKLNNKYILMGTLIKLDEKSEIIKLNNENITNNAYYIFGKRKYMHSTNQYEYYITPVDKNINNFKIDLKNKYLFDGDTIEVNELEGMYKVTIYKIDELQYY